MDPTTEIGHETPSTVEGFYDALAPEYDTMTGFDKRFVQERPFFRLLVERYKIRKALDAGCGTGFHSLLLAQLGVDTTGVDASPKMVRAATRHAKDLSLNARFLEARLADLGTMFGPTFDAVFSLGNTTAHLLSDDELLSALESFRAILEPGGRLVLQNLNYDRILTEKQRVQSIKEVGTSTYVRFYDYVGEFVLFNILTIKREGGAVQESIKTVRLRPLLSSEWLLLLQRSKFDNIRLAGSIAMESYDRQTSKDLVIVAEKSGAP